jgi:hypothetical protein
MKSIVIFCFFCSYAFGQSSVETTENELIPIIDKADFASIKPFTGMKIRATWDSQQLYIYENTAWNRVFSDKNINEQKEKSSRKKAVSGSWEEFDRESNPNFNVEKNKAVSADVEMKLAKPNSGSYRYIMDDISKNLQIKLLKNERIVYVKVYSLEPDLQLSVDNNILSKKNESSSSIFYPYTEFSNENLLIRLNSKEESTSKKILICISQPIVVEK